MNVTCYSRGSSPPAQLSWTVNGERVSLGGFIPASSLFLFLTFIESMFQIYDEPPSQPHYSYTDPWAQETGRSQGQGVSDLYPGADTEVRVGDVWKVYFLHNCTLYSKHRQTSPPCLLPGLI